MTKLTDTQLVVLSAASNRDDGSILPLPSNLKGGPAAKVVDGLIRRGLAERIKSDRPAIPDLVRITRAGLEAIGVEAEAPAETVEAAPAPNPGGRKAKKATTRAKPTPKGRKSTAKGRHAATPPRKRDGGPTAHREGTKQALLIDLLRRPDGATVDQIAEATGWQRHTVRGAIAGALKKKLGLDVTSEKVEGVGRVYKLPA